MLRPETKARVRAVQLLYAWEIQGRLPLLEVASRTAALCRRDPRDLFQRAESLAQRVAADLDVLDRHAADASENWRLSRLGLIERAILRVGIWELAEAVVPPKVAIDEAVRLAHWFGGFRTPAFVNGVLDRVGHTLGRL